MGFPRLLSHACNSRPRAQRLVDNEHVGGTLFLFFFQWLVGEDFIDFLDKWKSVPSNSFQILLEVPNCDF